MPALSEVEVKDEAESINNFKFFFGGKDKIYVN